jgi:hypothetical protein
VSTFALPIKGLHKIRILSLPKGRVLNKEFIDRLSERLCRKELLQECGNFGRER